MSYALPGPTSLCSALVDDLLHPKCRNLLEQVFMLYLSEDFKVRAAPLWPSLDDGVQIREPEFLASKGLDVIVST